MATVTRLNRPQKPPKEQDPLVTPDEPSKQSYVDEAILLADVKTLEDDGLAVRRPEEDEWIETWAFYNGRHWTTWGETGNLVEIDTDDVPRIVLNYILHLVQTRLGHLTKNRPILQGLPGRSDEAARNATRVAVKVMEAYWRKLKLHKKLSKALLWALVCGKSFWKVYWDPTLGKVIRVPGPQQPVVSDTGQPMVHAETGEPLMVPGPDIETTEGDLVVEVAFPNEIVVDPGSEDLEHAQRLLHVTWQPSADVQRRWNLSSEEIKDLETEFQDDTTRNRLAIQGLDQAAFIARQNRVKVVEAWFRACEQYPQGLYAVIIGEEVKYQGPTPEGYPEIPFVEFDEIRTNGFWSTSTARQLRDINRIVNVEVSQQEHVRKVLRYKTLIPVQANVDKDAFDQRDDEVVEYWAPFAPSHLKPPEIPAHHIEIRNSLIAILKEIGGNFDVLAGKTSGEVRSGRQTAYLQEYAGTVLGIVAQQVEEAIEAFGNMALGIIQKKVREDRFEAWVGRDRRVQVLQFKGADLEGCGTIVVQPGSALPMSRTEKYDRIEKWMEMNWLDPKIGLKLLDSGDFDMEVFAEDEQDRQNADETIFKLEAVPLDAIPAAATEAAALAAQDGNMMSERYILRALKIEAFPFDNHAIHKQQLDRTLRKTRMYRESPPARRALVDAMWDWHDLLERGGPVELPLNPTPPPMAPEMGPGMPTRGLPSVPTAPPPEQGGAPAGVPGSPQSMEQQPPLGPAQIGAAGGAAPPQAESGAERFEGLPPVPGVPGPTNGGAM